MTPPGARSDTTILRCRRRAPGAAYPPTHHLSPSMGLQPQPSPGQGQGRKGLRGPAVAHGAAPTRQETPNHAREMFLVFIHLSKKIRHPLSFERGKCFAIQNTWESASYNLYGRGRPPRPPFKIRGDLPRSRRKRTAYHAPPTAARGRYLRLSGDGSRGRSGRKQPCVLVPARRHVSSMKGENTLTNPVGGVNGYSDHCTRCTLRHLPREAVPPGANRPYSSRRPRGWLCILYGGRGFRPLPYKLYDAPPMYFVWQNICPVPKANSGWRIYFGNKRCVARCLEGLARKLELPVTFFVVCPDHWV